MDELERSDTISQEDDIIDISLFPEEACIEEKSKKVIVVPTPPIISQELRQTIENTSAIIREFMNAIDFSGIINAMQNVIQPVIDACAKRINEAAAALVEMILDAISSLGIWIHNHAQDIVRTLFSHKEYRMISYVKTVRLIVPAAFFSTLRVQFCEFSIVVRHINLRTVQNRGSSDDGKHVAFLFSYC